MALFSFIGIAVTSATVVFLGRTEWDPIKLVSEFENPVVLVVAMLAICVATLATNIAANVVGPANDFVHLAPKRLSFRTAALLSCFIGILIRPWDLISDPTGYIYRWLIAYSSILGAVGGILIADYFIIRRTKLDLSDLYLRDGRYWYFRGFNLCAILAMLVGVAPSLPGLISDLYPTLSVPQFWKELYRYAWFVNFSLAMLVYLSSMSLMKSRGALPR
jgi:NCS1 family nucleobase:cation symporter-1